MKRLVLGVQLQIIVVQDLRLCLSGRFSLKRLGRLVLVEGVSVGVVCILVVGSLGKDRFKGLTAYMFLLFGLSFLPFEF